MMGIAHEALAGPIARGGLLCSIADLGGLSPGGFLERTQRHHRRHTGRCDPTVPSPPHLAPAAVLDPARVEGGRNLGSTSQH
jgi:hypothetical protein